MQQIRLAGNDQSVTGLGEGGVARLDRGVLEVPIDPESTLARGDGEEP